MPFQPGNKYGKGRPLGAENKLSVKQKKWLDGFLDGDFQMAEKDWQELSPSQRWNIRIKLLDFRIPRLRSEFVEADISTDDEEMVSNIATHIFKKALQDGAIIKYPADPG